MATRLASGTVTARLSGLRGRAITTAKGHHFVVDSPLTLGGPNEEINPLDLLLASLATHVAFVCERLAQEMGIALRAVAVTVTGEFDPRGVRGEPVDPQIQAISVRLNLGGPAQTEADVLAEAVRTRCLIYTTLARAVPITLQTVLEGSPERESSSTPPGHSG